MCTCLSPHYAALTTFCRCGPRPGDQTAGLHERLPQWRAQGGAVCRAVCRAPGLQGQYPGKALKLRRSLYGLRQAPRVWYDELCKKLRQLGFTPATIDSCMFIELALDDARATWWSS
eukprot:213489-Chlamydomonas_euryale.AAC.1